MYKKKIALLLVCIMCFSMIAPTFSAPHWAQNEIDNWVSKGWIKWYEQGTFNPNGYITRAEFTSLVNSAFGFYQPGVNKFKDVSNYAWYAEDVKIGVLAGYINGYSDTMFAPNAKIKREDVATIISRLLVLGNQEYSNTYNIRDFFNVSDYAKIPVSQVIKYQYIKGYENGNFGPKNYLTYAEAIVLLNRIIGKPIQGYNTYGDPVKKTILRGNYYISSKDFNMQNTIVKGNLTIRASAEDGEIFLDKINIEGDLFVFGGGANSIHLSDTKAKRMHVNKSGNPARIVMEEYSAAEELLVSGKSILEEAGDTLYGFSDVKIIGPKTECVVESGYIENIQVSSAKEVTFKAKAEIEKIETNNKDTELKLIGEEDAKINKLNLNGSCDIEFKTPIKEIESNYKGAKLVIKEQVKSLILKEDANIELEPKTKMTFFEILEDATAFVQIGVDAIIGSMEIRGKTDVRGRGIVEKANIYTKEASFEKRPEEYKVASSISLNLDGQTLTGSDKKIEKLSIRSDAKNWDQLTINIPTIFNTEIYPSDASNKKIKWEVIPITGTATVDTLGNVYPTKEGDIWLKASAEDGSNITAIELIHIGTGNENQKIQNLVVLSEDNLSIIKMNMKIKMDVKVYPENVKDKSVTWKVINREGRATIENSGELIAISEGLVEVVAIANDGSGIMGNKIITIKGEPDTIKPSIFGLTQYKVNQGGTVEVSSTEDGYIYFVSSNTPNNEAAFLEALVNKKGIKVKAIANKVESIKTESLEKGDYTLYAVDRSGNISDPSQIVAIEAFDNRVVVTSIKDYNLKNKLTDIEVQFTKGENEEQIEKYRVFISSSNGVGSLTKDTLSSYTSEYYTEVSPSGIAKYSIKLKETQKAIGMTTVADGPYRVVVLSVSKNSATTPNQMSLPSAIVNLAFTDTTEADNVAPIIEYARLENTVKAKINESGIFYFVPAVTSSTKVALEAAVSGGTGRKIACIENEELSLDISGLQNGMYISYAVDASDNVSNPSSMVEINKIINRASINKIVDLNYTNDNTDIVVEFSKAPDETLVKQYKIMVVPSALAGVFDINSASVLSNDLSHLVTKTGNDEYKIRLNNLMKDISRSAIVTGQTYKVFVFTEALDGQNHSLSEAKDLAVNYTDVVSVMTLSGLNKTRIIPGDTIQITSNTKGVVYMVPYAVGNTYASVLTSAANNSSARSVNVEANVAGTIIPTGLLDDEYKLILVDEYQNISAPTDKIYLSSNLNIANITNTTVASGKVTLEFSKVPNENNIFGYKVIVVPKAEVDAGFTYQQKIAVSDVNSTAVSKTGANSYTVEILNTSNDSNGDAINAGGQYTVFVISIPDGVSAKVMQISEGANYTPIN